MRCNKVLIAFAFIAIAANVNAAPIDLPIDGKNLPLNLDDVNKQISGLTQGLPLQGLPLQGLPLQGLPLQGLPVGDSPLPAPLPAPSPSPETAPETAPEQVQRRQEQGSLSPIGPGILQPDQIPGKVIGTVTGSIQKAESVVPNGNTKRADATTGQSGMIPNTDALKNTITGIISYPTNIFGGANDKETDSVQPQARQENGLSPTQVNQITNQIMDSITKFLPMGNAGTSAMPSLTGVDPQTRSIEGEEDLHKRLSYDNIGYSDQAGTLYKNRRAEDDINELNKRVLRTGHSADNNAAQPHHSTLHKYRRAEDPSNGLSPLQIDQITKQITDSIKKVTQGGVSKREAISAGHKGRSLEDVGVVSKREAIYPPGHEWPGIIGVPSKREAISPGHKGRSLEDTGVVAKREAISPLGHNGRSLEDVDVVSKREAIYPPGHKGSPGIIH